MGYAKMVNYYFPPGRVASQSQGYPLNSFKYLTRSPVIILFRRQDVMSLPMFLVNYFITQRMSPKITHFIAKSIIFLAIKTSIAYFNL